ncbi:hypothetical protein [Sphaerisporangium aureirubrum]|uniref:Immunity protein 35 domain-containing protein n=1 Tax=Sphaerisporangium aureirubrum TaxID=1544736 RepID=A0ABW1NGA9_9ACTN
MNADQARALAEEYLNGALPADEATEVGLHSFPAGHIAWSRPAEPPDPGTLPGVIGGACVVIDRHTGDVSIHPLLNPEAIAAQWPGPHPR